MQVCEGESCEEDSHSADIFFEDNALVGKSVSDFDFFSLVGKDAFFANLSCDAAFWDLMFGHHAWSLPFKGCVSRARDLSAEGLVRSDPVVALNKGLKDRSDLFQAGLQECFAKLSFRGAMKAFDLALGLRVIDPSVYGFDSKEHELSFKFRD